MRAVRLVRYLAIALLATEASGAPMTFERKEAKAVLVDDFVAALEAHAKGLETSGSSVTALWLRAFAERGVDPAFLERRLEKARIKESDPFAKYRTVTIETPVIDEAATEAAAMPVAIHAFRLDVDEDYDDVFNDDVYFYFITTHDDLLWGKVTSIYKGLDEDDAVFLSAEDRGVFGPKGEKLTPKNHTIVDIGVIESDGDDITQLKKVSDAIVDLAIVALSMSDPNAGAAAAKARAETKNLLRLVVELDDDDRLATDSLYFTPQSMAESLRSGTIHEFSRRYEHETFWTHFDYRLHFRLLR